MIKTDSLDGIVICSFEEANKLNAINSEEAKAAIGKHFDTAGTRLILDMGNISFIDSSGFGMLLSLLKKARGNSGSICICCLKPDVLALFKLLHLHNVFMLCQTVAEGIGSLE